MLEADTSHEPESKTGWIKKGLGSLAEFPKGVYFIIGNEFCERFSFYGLRSVLQSYFICLMFEGCEEDHALDDPSYVNAKDRATALIHGFTFLAYASAVIGGYAADCWTGKFTAIVSGMVVYIGGTSLLTVSAYFGWIGFSILALFFVGLGTGFIKSVVSSFVGDQILGEKAYLMDTVFFLFYFSINSGSLLSMLTVPYIGAYLAMWLAFAVPTALLIGALVVFVIGRPSYVRVGLSADFLVVVFQALWISTRERWRSVGGFWQFIRPWDLERAVFHYVAYGWGLLCFFPWWIKEWSDRLLHGVPLPSGKNWLDYARGQTNLLTDETVDALKVTASILKVFLPIPIFWSLYDQQATRWTSQAHEMSRSLFGMPDIPEGALQAVNPIILLAMIPIFNRIIYPFLDRIGLHLRPLTRIALGMVFTSCSFVVAAAIQFLLEQDVELFVLWQVPQYILLSAGEIMVSVTGLEYAYTQAPASMKSIIMAAWLTTVALGNILVVAVAELRFFPRQSEEFLFFATLMFLDSIFCMVWFRTYSYTSSTTSSATNFDSATLPSSYEHQITEESTIVLTDDDEDVKYEH